MVVVGGGVTVEGGKGGWMVTGVEGVVEVLTGEAEEGEHDCAGDDVFATSCSVIVSGGSPVLAFLNTGFEHG